MELTVCVGIPAPDGSCVRTAFVLGMDSDTLGRAASEPALTVETSFAGRTGWEYEADTVRGTTAAGRRGPLMRGPSDLAEAGRGTEQLDMSSGRWGLFSILLADSGPGCQPSEPDDTQDGPESSSVSRSVARNLGCVVGILLR